MSSGFIFGCPGAEATPEVAGAGFKNRLRFRKLRNLIDFKPLCAALNVLSVRCREKCPEYNIPKTKCTYFFSTSQEHRPRVRSAGIAIL
jgi:hypothetical protein